MLHDLDLPSLIDFFVRASWLLSHLESPTKCATTMTQLRWISWLNLKQHPILFQHGIYGDKNKEITKKERKRTLIQKRTIYNKQEKTLTCHYPCLKLQIQNSSRCIIMPNPKLITKKNIKRCWSYWVSLRRLKHVLHPLSSLPVAEAQRLSQQRTAQQQRAGREIFTRRRVTVLVGFGRAFLVLVMLVVLNDMTYLIHNYICIYIYINIV